MWVMGLSKEFSDAVESVKDQHFLLAKVNSFIYYQSLSNFTSAHVRVV
jgi:hypothetical protein